MVKPGPKMVRPLVHTPKAQSPNPQPAFLTEGGEEKGRARAAGAGAASLGLRLFLLADAAPAPSASLRGSPLSRAKALGSHPLLTDTRTPGPLSPLPPPCRRKQAALLS